MLPLGHLLQSGRSRFMHLADTAKARKVSGTRRRLDQFGQHAAKIGRMQEGDRRPHRSVPRPRIDEPDAGPRPDSRRCASPYPLLYQRISSPGRVSPG